MVVVLDVSYCTHHCCQDVVRLVVASMGIVGEGITTARAFMRVVSQTATSVACIVIIGFVGLVLMMAVVARAYSANCFNLHMAI